MAAVVDARARSFSHLSDEFDPSCGDSSIWEEECNALVV